MHRHGWGGEGLDSFKTALPIKYKSVRNSCQYKYESLKFKATKNLNRKLSVQEVKRKEIDFVLLCFALNRNIKRSENGTH